MEIVIITTLHGNMITCDRNLSNLLVSISCVSLMMTFIKTWMMFFRLYIIGQYKAETGTLLPCPLLIEEGIKGWWIKYEVTKY
jgi:hypothetical protein